VHDFEGWKFSRQHGALDHGSEGIGEAVVGERKGQMLIHLAATWLGTQIHELTSCHPPRAGLVFQAPNALTYSNRE
jgi:hypothetical protein